MEGMKISRLLTKLLFLSALLAVCFSAPAFSLGLGEIEVRSELNQPLDAEVALLSATPEDLEMIRVALASYDDFEQAEIDRPSVLSLLQFEVIHDGGQNPYIKISSKKPIKEPFLDFIVEANWPKGRLLREYTLLLDPPTLVAEAPAPVESPTVSDEPVVAAVSESSIMKPVGAVPVTKAAAHSSASAGEGRASSYGPTRKSDTLWEIALEMRTDSSRSIYQVMMSLLKSNPQAFYNNNVNNLKEGYVLQLDPAVVATLSRQEAAAEFTLQYQQWLAFKQSKSKGAGQVAEAVSGAGAPAADVASRDKPSAVVRESAHLKLVSPQGSAVASDQQAGGVSAELEQKLVGLREELLSALTETEAQRQENGELQSRMSELEGQLASLQRLLAVQDDTLSTIQDNARQTVSAGDAEALPQEPSVGGQGVVVAEVDHEKSVPIAKPTGSGVEHGATEASDSAVGDEPKSAEPELKSSPVVAPAPVSPAETQVDEGSLLADISGFLEALFADIMADPMSQGMAVAVVLVLLLLIALIIRRRRGEEADDEEYDVDSTFAFGDADAKADREGVGDGDLFGYGQVSPEDFDVVDAGMGGDTGAESGEDFSGTVSDFGNMSDADGDMQLAYEVDPLDEADVYLAYRRYPQAEELLKEAIQHDPQRYELRVKLMELYLATEDQDAFIIQAEMLHNAQGDQPNPLWDDAVAMGVQLCPGHPLFSQDGEGSAEFGEGDLFSGVGDANLFAMDETELPPQANNVIEFEPGLDEPFKLRDEDDKQVSAGDEQEQQDVVSAFDSLEELSDDELKEITQGRADSSPALDSISFDEVASTEEGAFSEGDLEGLYDLPAEPSDGDAGDEAQGGDSEGVPQMSRFDAELEALEAGDGLYTDAVEADLGEEDSFLGAAFELDKLVAADGAAEVPEVPEVPSVADEQPDLGEGARGDEFANLEEGMADFELDLVDGDGAHPLDSFLDEDIGTADTSFLPSQVEPGGVNLSSSDEDDDLYASIDELGTKLDLARAYIDMGDEAGASTMLGDVLKEGSEDQQQEAQELMKKIG
ncbi:MAG: hypothetical protein GXP10_02130 [Gammaproteobacteria bacterium]|nr:hypothetical protein [Gammaproteobacteria bacterium]